jgi:hypothetical protein
MKSNHFNFVIRYAYSIRLLPEVNAQRTVYLESHDYEGLLHIDYNRDSHIFA